MSLASVPEYVRENCVCTELVPGSATSFSCKLKPEDFGKSVPVDKWLESHAVHVPCDLT